MRPYLIAILSIFFFYSGNGQTFLDAYKSYRLAKADEITNSKTRKYIKSFIKSHIIELDTVFQSYKAKRSFNFNTADTLYVIYYSPAESPFTSDIIIWSGSDTISYSQGFETIKPFKYKRTITYQPFIVKQDNLKGFKVITERDSVLTLVAKRDFATLNHLGDNQNIYDGSHVSIYVAYKDKGKFKIESCFPRQFIIRDTYRLE